MPAQSSLPLLARAALHGARTAVIDRHGEWSYAAVLAFAARVAAALRDSLACDDLREARVAFLAAPGLDWVGAQWGIWLAGGIAVPLCSAHPEPELAHVIADSGAAVLLADRESAGRLAPLAGTHGSRLLVLDDAARSAAALPALDVAPAQRAMILYTSGTTGAPKGVVFTHRMLQAQIECLVGAWGWDAADRILHVLPLHHVHGIVNALCCALWSGAACEMLPRFDARAVWETIAAGRVTLLMAVPTIYQKLIAAWERASSAERGTWSQAAAVLRLMVSGSAALPVPVLERWRAITGHVLLERYGMTEIGMALSNPLYGERVPGSVGTPLPGVEVRLADERGADVATGEPGEILVRGPGVFCEYWNRPQETRDAFADGWFRTGDIATVERGCYRILGRRSVDILKTGGYKVSALEIEHVLRAHPAIDDCAVVGIADETWGERVGAAVVLRHGHELALAALRAWAADRLAPYKLPTRLLVLDVLPRNALGKVLKPELTARFAH